MNNMRILLAEPDNFSLVGENLLREVASVERRAIRQEEMSQALVDYDVVWTRLHLKVRQEDIPANPRCRFVVTATTGTDHLAIKELHAAGIQVLSLRGHKDFLETISVTADLALALILAVVRRIPAAVNSVVQQGRWERDAFRGVELYGKTAGVLGFGRLGKKISASLLAIGMRIVVWDPYVEVLDERVEQATSFKEFLQQSDVITLHVPLTDETRNMMNRQAFGEMKSGAFLVNTSRGMIIDEDALLDVLEQGKLGGAALDVLCGEPHVDVTNPLIQYARKHENLIITPHIGGAVVGVMARCEEYLANILIGLLLHENA